MAGKNKAVFVDRDGTLIHERHYLSRVKDIRLFSCAVPALKKLRDAGFKIIMVTNQSGIGRGYLTEKKLLQIHVHLNKLLSAAGVPLDGVYYCPHHPDVACGCRKPKLGMVEQARKRFSIDLKRSFTIGDHAADVKLGQAMGGGAIFVLTGHGREEYPKLTAKGAKPDHVAKNILAAARYITAHGGSE
ncbi:MAG: HAD family hydrolase [Elusimicrobia bacterium]|nr:HAD family hydrolase [Elusimicrobiota bacterium]